MDYSNFMEMLNVREGFATLLGLLCHINILDLVVVFLLMLYSFRSYKRGATKVLLNLVLIVLIYVTAWHLSEYLVGHEKVTQTIYQLVNGVLSELILRARGTGEPSNLIALLDYEFSTLPFRGSLSSYLPLDEIRELSADASKAGVDKLVQLLMSILVPVTTMISRGFFFVVFVLLGFIAKGVFLKSVARKVVRLPIVKQVDSVLGLALGLFEGILISVVILGAMYTVFIFTGGTRFLTTNTFAGSHSFNLLLSILGLQ